jgi:hypothetical protein
MQRWEWDHRRALQIAWVDGDLGRHSLCDGSNRERDGCSCCKFDKENIDKEVGQYRRGSARQVIFESVVETDFLERKMKYDIGCWEMGGEIAQVVWERIWVCGRS